MSDFDLSFEWLWLLMFYSTNAVTFFKKQTKKSYVVIVFLLKVLTSLLNLITRPALKAMRGKSLFVFCLK